MMDRSSIFDEELLKNGDRRNVVDKYRNMTVEAIKSDLDEKRFDLEIAVENFQHDFNIGAIVRVANAFNVSKAHIIGRRHWNRRGAMVTDRYMNIEHHTTVNEFIESIDADREIVAIDIVDRATNLSKFKFKQKTVLVFGGEGPGISEEMLSHAKHIVNVEQFGSTRSINVGIAAGIAMYAWMQQNVLAKKLDNNE